MSLANIFQPKKPAKSEPIEPALPTTIEEEKVKEPEIVQPKIAKKCYAFPSLQTGLKDKMEALCNDSTNQSLCDATFEIGRNRQTFHIVSALFVIHSSELDNMLRSNRDKVIVIEDITADCFKFLRFYFYALNPIICSQNVADILYASTKLKISPLLEATKDFILDIQNINDILLVMSNLHRLSLYDMCNQKIFHDKLLQDAAPIFNSTNLNILPTALMIRLLQSAQFKTIKLTEEEIFEKCVIWAKYQAEVNKINSNKAVHQQEQGYESFKEQAQSLDKEEAEEDIEFEESPGGVVVEEDDASEVGNAEITVEAESDIEDIDGNAGSIKEEEDDQDWKNVITPILPYIRFPIMSGNYFASKVFDMKLLSSEDATMIMQWQFTKKDNEALKYSTKIRVK